MHLRAKGVVMLPLYTMNRLLADHGLVVYADKVREREHIVPCLVEQGRIEEYGIFELQRLGDEALRP